MGGRQKCEQSAIFASRPSITATTYTLPFDRCSPRDFERLCLWLVEREGSERAEHLRAVGSEQGRGLVAWRAGERWAFQCKRVQRFGPGDAEAEVDKVLGVPEELRPDAENRGMFEEWIAPLEVQISEP